MVLADPNYAQSEIDLQWGQFGKAVNNWLSPNNPGPDNWALASVNELARGVARPALAAGKGTLDLYLATAVDAPMIALETAELYAGNSPARWEGISSIGQDEGGTFLQKAGSRALNYGYSVSTAEHWYNQYNYIVNPTPENAAKVQTSSASLGIYLAVAEGLQTGAAQTSGESFAAKISEAELKHRHLDWWTVSNCDGHIAMRLNNSNRATSH